MRSSTLRIPRGLAAAAARPVARRGRSFWRARHAGGRQTGEAEITRGCRLPESHVIHTVAPAWRGGSKRGRDCWRRRHRAWSALAAAHGVKLIAFPAVSTGFPGLPADHAARIAVAASLDAARETSHGRVSFCCFSPESAKLRTAASMAFG